MKPPSDAEIKRSLQVYYQRMEKHFGVTHWWPGDTPFEIAIGAILTQNTAWTNVEKAIANLKREKLLKPQAILDCPREKLEAALRPSGYFRQKTDRVQRFSQHLLDQYRGSMARMAKRPLPELRHELLELNGIGPETADDILLYACEKPIFVIDAYTKRILTRHGIVPHNATYHQMQELFHTHLKVEVKLFAEYHGLIVWTGKHFCKTTPHCKGCPLETCLKKGQPILLE